MTPSKRSARSIATVLLLTLLALALPACKPASTRPSIAPTPPLVVNCDRTPAPAVLPHVPPLNSAADILLNDEWKAIVVGAYEAVVTIRNGEHACWDALRSKGVIQ